ncbi:NADP-dependent oxidoreductase [Streptomyces canus]|uniref:NADP-dependent oxidoreductase n=1 Tax=Streptomyces canus TaxID=58343 RepID=UPI00324CFE4A
MRAISQDTLGAPDVLHEVELPKPVPGVSEVLVAVHAAGVNPTDWKNRAQSMTAARMPRVLGWDVSGVVEAVGVGVTVFKPGDEVFGMLPYPGGAGAHAEYVTAPARVFTHKPAGIDHVQAGALPLAALTAYQALVDTAGVRAGQRVLIHAAAGGVGHLAVQIAKSRGAYVIGTASNCCRTCSSAATRPSSIGSCGPTTSSTTPSRPTEPTASNTSPPPCGVASIERASDHPASGDPPRLTNRSPTAQARAQTPGAPVHQRPAPALMRGGRAHRCSRLGEP